MMNLMVFVIIMIMIMPGSDLVIVVAPFDQRNLALKYTWMSPSESSGHLQ